MTDVGQAERDTQNRVIDWFKNQLGYDYLDNWQYQPRSSPIEENLLRDFLHKQGYNAELIRLAISKLNDAVSQHKPSLYDLNKDVYSVLRYGIAVQQEHDSQYITVNFIDWQQPFNNHFAIAEEVTITGENTKRPDIVLYVNGIALGVLELKKSSISVSEGIRQNLLNQQAEFIKPFFATMQLIMAGNDSQGIRYGTVDTTEKYYLTWKEPSEITNRLQQHLTQLCEKSRLLEIVHDFVLFDGGIKKLPRPHQYFGVKAGQERIRRREGGIIWHTQGSGKSLTMVWLAKWIKEFSSNARVLIITDREELDGQIETVFAGVGETIYRTKSCHDLITTLNTDKKALICSLIHKFGRRQQTDYNGFIEQLKHESVKAKGDIIVFIDECHRTQSGDLHIAMKQLLPNALFIGFTGTPLLKKDKKHSIAVFGSYIHTYKFNEGVADGVILDLRYEARKVEQIISSKEKIDLWFETKTKGLTETAKNTLKQRWGTLQKVLSSKDRLANIVKEILMDMDTKDRLKSGRGNALLVAANISQACQYYELFQQADFKNCAIISSYNPSLKEIKDEQTGEGRTEKQRKYDTYKKMLNGKTVETFEKEVKRQFIKNPAQMRLLIVVDKLLTGFDAPCATYLYIDKAMKDHGLFQAICRVNRLDGVDKAFGYIVDYKDLFKSLHKAVDNYTHDAFESYDKEDVENLLKSRLQQGKERLDTALEQIKGLCEAVKPPYDSQDYFDYFSGEAGSPELEANKSKRLQLYQYTATLIRAYTELANEMLPAGYSEEQAQTIKKDVKHYESIRQEVKLHSCDYIDLKLYEPAMRHLIDSYIGAEESKVITNFGDLTLVQLLIKEGTKAVNNLPKGLRENKEAVAETIENNVHKTIVEKNDTNPKYYVQMSTLLAELIEARKKHIISYEAYLKKMIELAKKIEPPTGIFDTPAKQALYDNLNQDIVLVLALHEAIMRIKKADWRGDLIKEREIEGVIAELITEDATIDRIFELVKNQHEY